MSDNLLLTMEDWDRIRLNFTDSEKNQLNAAIVGEVLCPRGCIVDAEKAPDVCKKVREITQAPSYKSAYEGPSR